MSNIKKWSHRNVPYKKLQKMSSKRLIDLWLDIDLEIDGSNTYHNYKRTQIRIEAVLNERRVYI